MSNDDDSDFRSETKVGQASGPEPASSPKKAASDRSFADTIPTSEPPTMQHQSSNTTDDLVSSAPARMFAGHAQASGAVTISGERISEALARELIARRMTQEGYEFEEDFAYSRGELLVNLDGFDAERSVGFQYISHTDADVVTDVDSAVEDQLRELSEQGVAHILVIHDHDVTTADVVVERVEAFLARLLT